jgi:bacteriocin biosynthesis cyclodehydratase domain-containing protein
MFDRPKIKDCYDVVMVEGDYVFLLREESYKVLAGPKYKQLAPLLDGSRTFVELMFALAGQMSPAAIQYALNQLEAQGCLTEGDERPFSPRTAFVDALDVAAQPATNRLQEARVQLTALGGADLSPLQVALEREGLLLGEGAESYQVVVVDDYLADDLAAINQAALAQGRPWLLLRLAGLKSWLGPLFQPGETACWACLAHRLRANRQVESFLARHQGQSRPIQPPLPMLPTTVAMAASLAVTELFKWIAQGSNGRLTNRLLTFDHLLLAMEAHTVVRRPQCPVCGDPQLEASPRPVRLAENSQQTLTTTLRSRRPEEVFEQYKSLISPISGVITSLTDVTQEKNGLIYNYVAGHYFPLINDSVFWLRQKLKAHTGGKGTSQIQAKVSAIGEAVERYSTSYWGREAAHRGSYRSMTGKAIHPHDCLGFSDAQYAGRVQWNEANAGSYQIIPFPFREEVEVAWTPVWSLTNQEFNHVLATICYYGHPDARHFFNTVDSNGVAAGSSLTEALLQGFSELVERDSVGIWWYNRLNRPGVDLASFQMPYLAKLQQYYQARQRQFWLLDITADLQMPAFAAVSRRIDSPVEDIIYGFGANLNPQAAVMQAVTEMNQCLPAVSNQKPDGTTDYAWSQRDAILWWQTATVANQPYLLPDPNQPARPLADYPLPTKGSLTEKVEQCVAIAREAGLEVLALEATRPDIGMAVCRVIVPGMCHFWRRLRARRLYEVPVKMGWLERPRLEAEMNPYAIFF